MITRRIIQSGEGTPRALVVLYLVGPQLDEAVRSALGPQPFVVGFVDPAGEPLEKTVAWACEQVGLDGFAAVALVGYSRGCLSGVRARLRSGADPSAVLAIDGLHASLPPEAWQIDTWMAYAERARAGERLLVLTATQQTYTEQLPPGQRFLCSLNGLRQVTGWPLDEEGPVDAPAHTSKGELHAYVYASLAIDAQAHIAQMQHALPEMLRKHLAPWLARFVDEESDTNPAAPAAVLRRGSRGPFVQAWQERLLELGHDPGTPDGAFGPVTEAATRAFQRAAGLADDGVVGPATRAAADAAIPPTPAESVRDLGELLLAMAVADIGEHEEPAGSNDGPAVRRYFAGAGVAPPANWCAAALWFWLRGAADALGVEPPVAGSVGAKAWMAQLQRAGRWLSAEDARREPSQIRPGMIAVWHRGAPGAWTGHVGVVVERDGAELLTVEANSGPRSDAVAEMRRPLADPNLLGLGWVD